MAVPRLEVFDTTLEHIHSRGSVCAVRHIACWRLALHSGNDWRLFARAKRATSGLIHQNGLRGVATRSATRLKRCELLWTGPIERNVFARIRRPLKLVPERIDRTHHRFAPGH